MYMEIGTQELHARLRDLEAQFRELQERVKALELQEAVIDDEDGAFMAVHNLFDEKDFKKHQEEYAEDMSRLQVNIDNLKVEEEINFEDKDEYDEFLKQRHEDDGYNHAPVFHNKGNEPRDEVIEVVNEAEKDVDSDA